MAKTVKQSPGFSSVRKSASIDWLLLPYDFSLPKLKKDLICDLKSTSPRRPPSGGLAVGGWLLRSGCSSKLRH